MKGNALQNVETADLLPLYYVSVTYESQPRSCLLEWLTLYTQPFPGHTSFGHIAYVLGITVSVQSFAALEVRKKQARNTPIWKGE